MGGNEAGPLVAACMSLEDTLLTEGTRCQGPRRTLPQTNPQAPEAGPQYRGQAEGTGTGFP